MRKPSTNVISLACALCLAVIVSGCTRTPDPGATRPAQAPTGDVTDTSDIDYGIRETSDSISATGRLLNLDDEQGLFWAIVREPDPLSSASPPLIAVLANPEQVDAQEHSGEMVRITGVQDQTGATDRGVPAIRADELETLADPVDPNAPIAE
ncbi:MAG: hypothetical protein ACYC6C_00385 [Coriobacteriia bacterium]